MKQLLTKLKTMGNKGDTIVEVLIAVALVSLVLSAAYATSNRSLSSVRDTQEHEEAATIAQTQLERIKSVGDFNAGPSSCLDETNVPKNTSQCVFSSENKIGCVSSINGICYNVVVSFIDPTPEHRTYRVTVTWERIGGGGSNSVTEIYRLPIVTASAIPPPPPPPPPCPSANHPDISTLTTYTGDGRIAIGDPPFKVNLGASRITAGCYFASLVTYDDHHNLPARDGATDETWKVGFLDSSGILMDETDYTEDLPDTWLQARDTFASPINLPRDATAVIVTHGPIDASGRPGSLVPQTLELRKIYPFRLVKPV